MPDMQRVIVLDHPYYVRRGEEPFFVQVPQAYVKLWGLDENATYIIDPWWSITGMLNTLRCIAVHDGKATKTTESDTGYGYLARTIGPQDSPQKLAQDELKNWPKEV